MARKSKRSKAFEQLLEKHKAPLAPEQALALLRKAPAARFDQSVEVHVRLGIDPGKSDQTVRGSVTLPAGTGRQVRVAVAAEESEHKKAEQAGADPVGRADLIEAIRGGRMDFDVLLATPGVMKELSQVAAQLGPRGLMPNPKLGSVVGGDLAAAVREFRGGKVEIRADKGAVVHLAIGRLSFSDEQLVENFGSLIAALKRLKPGSSKGRYLRRAFLSSSMGPGIELAVEAH